MREAHRMHLIEKCLSWVMLCLVGGLFLVPVSAADECLSPSPSLLQGRDPFEDISPKDLNASEQQAAMRLFQSLAGDWEGSADSFFCKSSNDPNKVERDQEKLRAKAAVNNMGDLSIAINFFSPQKNSSHQDTLRLYQSGGRIRIESDSREGDVEVIALSDNALSFMYRRIHHSGKRSPRGASARKEFFFTLNTLQGAFTIDQQVYFEGKLSSGKSWRFKR